MANVILSIVVISKDDINGFKKTIESIRSYITEEIQLVLVISDERREYLDYLSTCQNSTLVYNEDSGLYDAMNVGIAHAKGEYINFLNGGDVYARSKSLQSYISKLTGDLICFNVIRNGKIIRAGLDGVHPHQGIFYRANLLNEIKFDASFKIHGDMDHWYRVNGTYHLETHKHDLIYADFEGGGIGETQKLLSAKELFRIGKRHRRILRIISALNRLI